VKYKNIYIFLHLHNYPFILHKHIITLPSVFCDNLFLDKLVEISEISFVVLTDPPEDISLLVDTSVIGTGQTLSINIPAGIPLNTFIGMLRCPIIFLGILRTIPDGSSRVLF